VLAAVVAVAILVLWLLNTLLQRQWGAPWRVNILAAADALHYELEALLAEATPDEQDPRRSVGEAVEHHLEKAREAAWPEEKPHAPSRSTRSPSSGLPTPVPPALTPACWRLPRSF
jgi:hypothetical protein